jgi:hypothetical protein
MRLSSSKLAWLVSFLTGLFWATIFIGFFRGLIQNWHNGFFTALFSGIFWTIPGVLGVVILEAIIASFEKRELLKEQNLLLKKQVKLLEELKNLSKETKK